LLPRCIRLGEKATSIPLGGDIDRDLGLARDEQRLVAEFLRCPAGINQKWKRGTPPAVAA
jgi:hypothetical protein